MSILSRRYAVAAATGVAGLLSIAGASSAQALPGGVTADFGTNGRVHAFLAVGDKIFVAGKFTRVIDNGGSHVANNVAVYNKNTKRYDLGFSAPTNGAVTGLATSGGTLYLGGEFTNVKGVARAHVAAVNAGSGAVDGGFRADTNQNVDDVLVGNGKVYISGSFRTVNGANRNYVARLNLANGQPDNTWTPSPNGRVRDMALSNDSSAVFLAGSFSAVDGKGAYNKVARIGMNGEPTPGFTAGDTSHAGHQPVLSVAVGGGDRLILAVGGAGGACTSMNGDTGARQWSKRLDGDAQAAEVVGNRAWCGGHFERVDGVTRTKLAAFKASNGDLDGFNIDLNSNLGVWALAQSGSALLAGGDFTKVNQDSVNRIVSIVR